MTPIPSILEWFERITAWAIVRVLTMLYPELRLARDDSDRALVASATRPVGVKHTGLACLGVLLVVFLASLAAGAVSARVAFHVTASVSSHLQTLVSVVGFCIGSAVPFVAIYLLTRRSKRQLHLYLLRGLDAVICPSCGYSMHGHSQSETVTCPECGVTISE